MVAHRLPSAAMSARVSPQRPIAIGAVGLAAVLAAGIVLRFWTRSPLWLDEALTVEIARLPVSSLLDALRHDGHPPLYYLLLHGWIEVFGTGDLAVRSLSGLWALGALGLVVLAGRRLGGGRVAVATLVIMATSPFALRYATEARMYAMVMALVAAAWLLVLAALDRPSWPRLAGVALVTGALLLTHYWALYLGATVAGLLAWRVWRRRDRAAARVLAALAVGALAFLPWLGSFLYQAAHTGTPWGRPERPAGLLAVGLSDFGGGGYGEAQLLGFALFALALGGLVGRTLDRDRLELDLRTYPVVRREACVVAGTLSLSVVAGFAANSAFASRYLAMVFPLVVGMAGVGVALLGRRELRMALLAGLALLGLFGGAKNVVTERTQAQEIADAIAPALAPGDVVVFCPDQLGPSTARLLPDDVRTMSFPDGTDPDDAGAARIVDWVDYTDRVDAADIGAFAAAVDDAAADGRVWLVWSGGYGGLGTRCEELTTELAARRPALTVAVESGAAFEHAWLYRYDAP